MVYRWHLVVNPDAQARIDELTRPDMMLVFEKIKELLNAEDPTELETVTDIKKLRDPRYAGLWRKRAGYWRILYRVQPGTLKHLKVEYKGKLIVTAIVNRRDL